VEPGIMQSPLRAEGKRRSPRSRQYRAAKIRSGAGAPARDCLVIDISDGGIRLNVEGLDVPDEFVLLLAGDRTVQERTYKVIWRLGDEVGAEFVCPVRGPGFALRD
jgi:hypothetical protein